jgi:uncharacterized protein with predicted RNA binding PUA domain
MDDVAMLRTVADYQFGRGAGAALFDGDLEVSHTSSGRPRQVHAPEGRLVTYGTDGRFTLGLAGGRRLRSAFESPRHRVVVGEESAPYVREGRNAFAKFVRAVDETLRPGDEAVVEYDGAVLGVGRLRLPGPGVRTFETGVAVDVRHGAGPAETAGDGGG